MPASYKRLAEMIEATRLARNVTPAEAARQIGAQPTQFSRWRRGVGGISMDHLAAVATWMNVPLAELLPLAGYPSITAEATPPRDPALARLNAMWDRLPKSRKEIILEIAQRGAAVLVAATYVRTLLEMP